MSPGADHDVSAEQGYTPLTRPPNQSESQATGRSSFVSAPSSFARRFTGTEVKLYHSLDELTGALLLVMVVFSPWAFGTTQKWSIWTMNISGYVLGAALLGKLVIRRLRGYCPPRWDEERQVQSPNSGSRTRADNETSGLRDRRTGIRITQLLVLLSLALLAWCLTSAINARATFHNETLVFEYHECVPWLPHSLDREASWFAFWMYLGLAGTFWAARDWLLGKSAGEFRQGRGVGIRHRAVPPPSEAPTMDAQVFTARFPPAPQPASSGFPFPARLRRLLWVLAINGAVLGVEAIIQRAANSPELLFLVKPRIHQSAEGQFGPYAYRSNAAQYFNLLWPVCIGFWWSLNRNASPRQKRHHLLLVAAAILAACPMISTSRAGAIITVAIALAGGCFFALTHWFLPERRTGQPGTQALRSIAICVACALVAGLALGWKALAPRLAELNDGLEGREQLYEAARPMAGDYPLLGTGPGTFETVSQLYPRPDIFWPAQLHNDWLETRITFGWLGSALIALAFLGVLACWFTPGRIHGGRRFVALTWLSLAGCLLHARYDFPFQIHSTLFLFLLLCAMLTTLSRRPAA